MQLRISNIVFVDSYQFQATSLVKDMRKSGVEKFATTIRHFGHNDVYFTVKVGLLQLLT